MSAERSLLNTARYRTSNIKYRAAKSYFLRYADAVHSRLSAAATHTVFYRRSVDNPSSRIFGYEYNDKGLRTKLVYPDACEVTYEYDTLSRISAIKYNGQIIAEYQYDDLSRRTLLTYGNDANIGYQYNNQNQLTMLSNGFSDVNIAFNYTGYDKAGNRKNCKVNDANTQIYDCDKLYQLTFADYNDGNKTRYYYDELGNRTKVTKNTDDTLYDSNALNQYKTVGGTSYNYDKNGNLADINNEQFMYIYDCENRLIEAKQNSVSVATYKYDFAGRRVSKATGNGGIERAMIVSWFDCCEKDSENVKTKVVTSP